MRTAVITSTRSRRGPARRSALEISLAAGLVLAYLGCATTPPPGQPPPPPPAPRAQTAPPPATPAQPTAPADASARLSPAQLDSLVAPIALYPDPLLAQCLAASTYPVEIIQLQQWLAKHPGLKDQALADALAKQPWDASVQALAAMPEVVKRLADDIQWTTDLGNAFLAQQQDVMDAVQRMRGKAKANGNLNSSPQQVVDTPTVDGQTVIVIQPASTQVVYVPVYNPVVVYGPPIYPYPPIYYPPYPPPGAVAVSFTFGIAMGVAMGGAWGWGCGWGHSSTVIINNKNTYIRNGNPGGGNNWQHRPEHRGGTPYPSRGTADRYGGGQASQRAGGGAGASNRTSGAGVSNRASGAGVSNRSAGPSGGGRPSTGGVAAGAGADRIGSRDLSRSGGSGQGAFGGGSAGYSGARANSLSSRGGASMGGAHGGGGRRR